MGAYLQIRKLFALLLRNSDLLCGVAGYETVFYGTGRGIEKDDNLHYLWLERAAKNNHVLAQYYMVLKFVEDELIHHKDGGYQSAYKWMCRLDKNPERLLPTSRLWRQKKSEYTGKIEVLRNHSRARICNRFFYGKGRKGGYDQGMVFVDSSYSGSVSFDCVSGRSAGS